MDQAMNPFKYRVLIAALGICASGALPAQNWCTPGATWWYEHWGNFGNQVGVVQVQCVGDTLILGETVHGAVASVTGYDFWTEMPYQFALADIVTKSTTDQVSYWDGTEWHLLFDLSVGIGDSWILSGYNFADRTIEVVDTGSMIVDDEPLRYSVVTFAPPFQGLTAIAGDTIIERIGYKRLFIDPNRTVGMDGDVYDLRCYEDNELFYTILGDDACDLQTGLHERSNVGRSVIAPNPSDGRFTVSYPVQSEVGVLEIRDALGRIVLREQILPRSSESHVVLKAECTGLYFCQVSWAANASTVRVMVGP